MVLTGAGAISSIGVGITEFLAGLRAGRSEVRPISAFDTAGFEYANGCEVTGFEPKRWIERLDPEHLGRAAQFTVAAARMAATDAGLRQDTLARGRVLIAVGTTDGETRDLDLLVEQDAAEQGAMDPVIARRASASRLATSVAREFALTDVEAVTIPTACAAGNYAIGYGLDAIRSGEVDLAFCGGGDAICRKTFAGFYRLGTIAPEQCQPFDLNRKGILTGEGAGCWSWRASTRPSPVEPGSTPRSSGTGSTATRTTRSRRSVRASPTACGWRSRTRASNRGTWT